MKIKLEKGDHIVWKLHQYTPDVRRGVVVSIEPLDDDGDGGTFDATLDTPEETDRPVRDVWGYMGLIDEINGIPVRLGDYSKAEYSVNVRERCEEVTE